MINVCARDFEKKLEGRYFPSHFASMCQADIVGAFRAQRESADGDAMYMGKKIASRIN